MNGYTTYNHLISPVFYQAIFRLVQNEHPISNLPSHAVPCACAWRVTRSVVHLAAGIPTSPDTLVANSLPFELAIPALNL